MIASQFTEPYFSIIYQPSVYFGDQEANVVPEPTWSALQKCSEYKYILSTCQASRIPRDCPANLCIVPLSRVGELLSRNFALLLWRRCKTLDLHPRPIMESTHRHSSVSDHDRDHQDSASDSTEATASCRALQAPDKLQQHPTRVRMRVHEHNFCVVMSVSCNFS